MSIEIPQAARDLLDVAHSNAIRFGVCKLHMERWDQPGCCCMTGHIFKADGINPNTASFHQPPGPRDANRPIISDVGCYAMVAAAHAIGHLSPYDQHLLDEPPDWTAFNIQGIRRLAMTCSGRIASWNDTRGVTAEDVRDYLHNARLVESVPNLVLRSKTIPSLPLPPNWHDG